MTEDENFCKDNVLNIRIGEKNYSLSCQKQNGGNKNAKFWHLLVIILIIISGYLYYYSNEKRVIYGYYETNDWIVFNNIVYVLFFGLVSGYLIALILEKTKSNGYK